LKSYFEQWLQVAVIVIAPPVIISSVHQQVGDGNRHFLPQANTYGIRLILSHLEANEVIRKSGIEFCLTLNGNRQEEPVDGELYTERFHASVKLTIHRFIIPDVNATDPLALRFGTNSRAFYDSDF